MIFLVQKYFVQGRFFNHPIVLYSFWTKLAETKPFVLKFSMCIFYLYFDSADQIEQVSDNIFNHSQEKLKNKKIFRVYIKEGLFFSLPVE